MIKFSIAFLLGVVILTMFETLPHWQWIFGLLPAIGLAFKFPRVVVLAGIAIGFLWGIGHAYLKLYPELDRSLEGVDIEVTGRIVSIPSSQERSVRFEFSVANAKLANSGEKVVVPEKIRLNWYGKFPSLQLGENWKLRVRLKRPWGFANIGSFDYEKWLFEHDIRATGYVRESKSNQRLNATEIKHVAYFIRAWLHKQLQKVESGTNTAVINALALGERGEMSTKKWQMLTATGTNHLLAISGLHISLISGFVFFIVLRLWRFSETLCLYMAAQRVAALAGIVASVLYAMLAGFAIPTQRAMIMAGVVFMAIYFSKTLQPWNILAIALCAVLVWDPFAVLAPGFWLSFLAVALIFFAITGKRQNQSWLFHMARVQFILALGLLPVTLVFFQQASLISPIANFFAVPWVSFIVVPLVLIGSGLLAISEGLASGVLQLANYSIDVFWMVLTYLHEIPLAKWSHATPDWALIPAAFGILLLLSPGGWPLKALSLVLLSPLVLAPASDQVQDGELRVTILDVGQGLATILESAEYVIVYDVGPKFGTSFNAGKSVVVPYLRERGIDEIDMLIVSHADKDHAGGVQSVLEEMDVKRVITSKPFEIDYGQISPCLSGVRWEWDGVHFEFLHPPEKTHQLSRNNRSCVLSARHLAGSVLITGDIERSIERFLVENQAELLDTDVLVVPHHGSNSSSTTAFIRATSPQYAIFSTGYRNSYGFPDEKVVARYEDFGSALMDTASQGMITFVFSSEEGLQLDAGYRKERQKFWHSRF